MAIQFKACSVDGCNRDPNRKEGGARGMCRRHYNRLRKYGDPLAGPTFNGEPIEFLLNVVVHYDGDECLEWPFAKNSGGYGVFNNEYVHRLVCESAHGSPPSPNHEAAHSCGKRACVAKNHLSWKTPAANQQDRIIHGTHHRGERCNLSKLTEEQVREILSLRGKAKRKDIARLYGVSVQNVDAIYGKRTWAWLS